MYLIFIHEIECATDNLYLPTVVRLSPTAIVHWEDSHVYLLLMLMCVCVCVCKTGYFLPTCFLAMENVDWRIINPKTKTQQIALTYLILTGRFSQFNEVVMCKCLRFAFSVSFSLGLQLFTFWHEDFPWMRKRVIQQCCADSHFHEGDERSSRNILSIISGSYSEPSRPLTGQKNLARYIFNSGGGISYIF